MHLHLLSLAGAQRKRLQMWRALEHVYAAGLARAIGVSNFSTAHLDALLPECKVAPMMLQVEVHPYHSQDALITYAHQHGMRVTAYCPLGSGKLVLLQDATVCSIVSLPWVPTARVDRSTFKCNCASAKCRTRSRDANRDDVFLCTPRANRSHVMINPE